MYLLEMFNLINNTHHVIISVLKIFGADILPAAHVLVFKLMKMDRSKYIKYKNIFK